MKKQPYIFDLFASICIVAIFILSSFVQTTRNDTLKIAGVVLLAAACILWILPVMQMKKYGRLKPGGKYFDTTTIVDRGLFSLVRHPQYLAYILLVTGFALLSQHWSVITLTALAIIFFYLHTVEEEKELIHRYKKDYKIYCTRVPRFNLIRGIYNSLKNRLFHN